MGAIRLHALTNVNGATLRNLVFLDSDAKKRAMHETTWVDGLRGIAAIFVVCSHLVLCYARALVRPCCADNSKSPYLFQLPVLRLVSAGQSWVALFFILSGFVNALKPLQLARSGQVEKALSKLALSSFSRIFRLVLPATAATLFSWTLCQLGLYETGRESDAYWLAHNSPPRSHGLYAAFTDLLSALRATWMIGDDNPYDQPQWALIYLLEASMMIIIVLLLTINMTPRWRTVSLFLLSFWSIDWSIKGRDPWIGICCFVAITLAELCLTDIPEKLAPISPFLSPPLALFALVLMSYPTNSVDDSAWSKSLHTFGTLYLPRLPDGDGFDRMYGSLGGLLLVSAIVISPHLRNLLSRRPLLWLGKVSFAVYLLHGMLLRTVFAWVLFAGQEKIQYSHTDNGQVKTDAQYPVPGFFQCALATLVLMPSVLVASHLWNMKLEPLFARITTIAEHVVIGKKVEKIPADEKTILPIRQD